MHEDYKLLKSPNLCSGGDCFSAWQEPGAVHIGDTKLPPKDSTIRTVTPDIWRNLLNDVQRTQSPQVTLDTLEKYGLGGRFDAGEAARLLRVARLGGLTVLEGLVIADLETVAALEASTCMATSS